MKKKQSPPNIFEVKIAPVVARAKQILERAGLPTDPAGLYTIPQGKPTSWPKSKDEGVALDQSGVKGVGTLLSLIEARPNRKRKDQIWYAAKILWLADVLRAVIRRGIGKGGNINKVVAWSALSLAAELGELVGEAKEKGYFGRKGKQGRDTSGKKRTAKQEPEWQKWREWSKEFGNRFPRIRGNKLAIAEKIQARILKMENQKVSIRTITNRI